MGGFGWMIIFVSGVRLLKSPPSCRCLCPKPMFLLLSFTSNELYILMRSNSDRRLVLSGGGQWAFRRLTGVRIQRTQRHRPRDVDPVHRSLLHLRCHVSTAAPKGMDALTISKLPLIHRDGTDASARMHLPPRCCDCRRAGQNQPFTL